MRPHILLTSGKVCFMFSLVNEGLNPREELIGLHVLPGTCAHTLASLIQDVLIYVNAAVGNHKVERYDGTNNISETKFRVAIQIIAEEPRTISTHCSLLPVI